MSFVVSAEQEKDMAQDDSPSHSIVIGNEVAMEEINRIAVGDVNEEHV